MDEKYKEVSEEMKVSRFFIDPKEFILPPKVSINKSELSKAVNVSAQSGESGYALIPRSYDKVNREFEDETVNSMKLWLKDAQKNLEDEIKKFYKF